MKKLTSPFLLSIACISIMLIYSCKKDINHFFDDDKEQDIQWAKDYYVSNLQIKETYKLNITASADRSIATKNESQTNEKKPHWAESKAGITPYYDYVELPLTYTHKISHTFAFNQNPNVKPIPNQKIIDASFDRLVIYKDKRGKINQRIISFIPDEAYLTRHKNNISHNRIEKLDKDFTGYLHYKDWNGKLLFILRIENGKPIKRYSGLTNIIQNPNTEIASIKTGAKNNTVMVLPVEDPHCYLVSWDWYQDCYYETENSSFPYYCDPAVVYNVQSVEIPCLPTGGGDGGGGGSSDPPLVECLGILIFETGECILDPPLVPDPLDSILKDTCLNATQMTSLRNMFTAYLEGEGNDDWKCLRKKQYDLMKSLGVKFGFCIKTMSGAVQAYDPQKDNFYFSSEASLNYSYNFDHEFFHGYQNKSLTSGTLAYAPTTNPSTGVTTYPDGFLNMEFETALYIDIARARFEQSAFVNSAVPDYIRNEYIVWLNSITLNNTKYPKTYADFGGQYFYFMEKFKQYSGYSDKGNIVTNILPTTLLNLFSTTNCK